MSWTTPPTLTDGQVLTGAHTQIWRDDLNTAAPALATTAGSIFAATGTNAIAERIPQRATVSTAQSTSTTATFGDLSTVGPAVTVTSGTSALVWWSAQIENSSAGAGGYMGFAVSGASTIAAGGGANVLRLISGGAGERNRAGVLFMQTGLTAGSNIFTAKYTTPTGGTATFQDRDIGVIPF